MSNEHITDDEITKVINGYTFAPLHIRKMVLDALALRPAAQPVGEPRVPLIWQNTLEGRIEYILQDDANTSGTRIVDIAYSAFMSGATGKNKDDGGKCDWFNDTKPMVMEAIEQIRRDLKKAQKTAPRPVAVPVGEPVAYAVMWGARPMRKHSVHFELPTAEQVAAEVTSNKTMIRPLVFGDTTPQPVAVPDRVPMTEAERIGLFIKLNASSVQADSPSAMFSIIVQAIEAHHGITTPKADK